MPVVPWTCFLKVYSFFSLLTPTSFFSVSGRSFLHLCLWQVFWTWIWSVEVLWSCCQISIWWSQCTAVCAYAAILRGRARVFARGHTEYSGNSLQGRERTDRGDDLCLPSPLQDVAQHTGCTRFLWRVSLYDHDWPHSNQPEVSATERTLMTGDADTRVHSVSCLLRRANCRNIYADLCFIVQRFNGSLSTMTTTTTLPPTKAMHGQRTGRA